MTRFDLETVGLLMLAAAAFAGLAASAPADISAVLASVVLGR